MPVHEYARGTALVKTQIGGDMNAHRETTEDTGPNDIGNNMVRVSKVRRRLGISTYAAEHGGGKEAMRSVPGSPLDNRLKELNIRPAVKVAGKWMLREKWIKHRDRDEWEARNGEWTEEAAAEEYFSKKKKPR